MITNDHSSLGKLKQDLGLRRVKGTGHTAAALEKRLQGILKRELGQNLRELARLAGLEEFALALCCHESVARLGLRGLNTALDIHRDRGIGALVSFLFPTQVPWT